MKIQDSPLSSENLRKNPKRFLTLLGITVEQFDSTFDQLYKYELENQKREHGLWKPERVEKLVNKYKDHLREYLTITFLYLRQYNTQEVIATVFGTSQSEVSKIIARMSVILEKILPVPIKAAINLAFRIQQIPEDLRKKYSATLIIDATEQRVERSQVQEKQKDEYSGKKKHHARKFQVSQTQGGFIVDITKSVGSSVHDFRVLKEQRLNPQVNELVGLMKNVILWADSAYQSIEKLFPNWIYLVNEKAKRNHPLTDEQKLKNRIKSKVRILIEHTISRIKKYRCCLERVRNMTDVKQSLYWNIVAGICNLRLATSLGIQQIFGYP